MKASGWHKPRTMPVRGETVRVTTYGDDYHRAGSVVHVSQGRVWVNFNDEREEVYPCSEIEVYREGR